MSSGALFSYYVENPDFNSGKWFIRRSAAPGFRAVGTSPAHASTTSGSPAVIVTCQDQMPTPVVQCAVATLISQVLRRWMLAGTSVDVVSAQRQWSANGGRQLASGEGRCGRRGFLVRDVIEETRNLMTESVVILSPDV